MHKVFLAFRGRLTVILPLAAALLLFGCGGGDSEGDSGGQITVESGSLTKAQFVEQAETVCQERREEFERDYRAFLNNLSPASSPSEERDQAGQLVDTIIVPVYRKLIDEIGSLGAPDGDEQEVTSFLEAVQRNLSKGEAEPKAFLQSNSQFDEAAKLATAYGLTGCADTLT